MESIYITPEHEPLREQISRFIAREVEPHAQAWEDAGFTPHEVLLKIGAAGLFGLMYDAQHGGADADALTNLVFAEALSQSTFAGFIITMLVHTDMASPHLHHAGTAAQKERYMPGVIAGHTITAVGISEPGAGSDVTGMRTKAVKDGNEGVLNGTKLFNANGVLGDLFFIAAKTGSARHAMSMFIVEKSTPGFTVGRSLDKTGWLCSDTAELVFDKQVIRQRIAMLDAKVRAARAYLYHCAWRVTQQHDVVQDVSMLKALTGELVNEVVQTCQQFHGGMGYLRGMPIERVCCDARILAIGGGATEMMLDEAAKRY